MNRASRSIRRHPRPTPWGIFGAAAISLVLTVLIVGYPEEALKASLSGLKLWFYVVFPALFPFFTMSEILMGLGVIHFAGVMLEPAMRPLFRIPGIGGFVVAIGLASGYPLGAKITGQVCRDGLCTPIEGERLVSFANTADPLFIVGAVAVGMLGMPEVGGIMVAAHYLAVLLVGLLMRFHAGGRMGPAEKQHREGFLLSRAIAALKAARLRDGRPIGQLFGDAVRSSLQSMLFIGGCIMMFAVFLQMLTVSGIVDAIAASAGLFLAPLGVDVDLLVAVIKGALEITIGSEAVSRADAASLSEKVIVASGIIGWSGLSVHAQVAAMVHGTGIRLAPYIFARLLHGILAGAFAWLLMGPLAPVATPLITPAFAPLIPEGVGGFWTRIGHSLTFALGITVAFGMVGAALALRRSFAGVYSRR